MRVIIAGSGLSGLITAHCLHQAGIDDFIILERRPGPVEQSGSVIGLFPQTFRVLDQIGVLDDILKLSPPLKRWIHLDPQGRTIYDGEFFDHLEKNHGHPSGLFMRRELMELLYSKLPDSEKRVLPNKKVVAVEQDDSSVTVTCADGSEFKGDILIGCDGVNSAVRRLAFSSSENGPKDSISSSRAEYRGLFGSSPRPDGLSPCNVTETHDSGIVFMILCTDERAFWLVTNLKDKNTPNQKYSDEDIQELANRYKDHSVAEGKKVTFGDLWETRNTVVGRPGMYDYHEGVAERWHDRRVVIVGDAAHGMTPNLGQGGNNSIEDVTSVVNKLHALVKEKPDPTTADFDSAFAAFQKEREKKVRKVVALTGSYTRWGSWRNWFGWFMQYWAWPLAGDRFIADWLLSPMIKESIKLDFVEEKNLPAGKVAWKYA